MANPLRIGVNGLGPRWRRLYRPALLALSDRFELRAVCDHVAQRAEQESAQLGCRSVAGPAALVERDDIEALLLCDPQWFGFWPLELACRCAKPVLCGFSPEYDEGRVAELHQRLGDHHSRVMVALGLQLTPAAGRLREVLGPGGGPGRQVVCDMHLAGQQAECGPTPLGPPPGGLLLGPVGLAVLNWCASLVGVQPVNVFSAGGANAALCSVFFEFDNGAAVQINRLRGPGVPSGIRLRALTDGGSVEVRLPHIVVWTQPDGRHVHKLRRQQPIGQLILEQFHEAIRTGQAMSPGWADAYRLLGWLRAARSSLDQGKRVPVPPV
jgi:predicted dehydrogenase